MGPYFYEYYATEEGGFAYFIYDRRRGTEDWAIIGQSETSDGAELICAALNAYKPPARPSLGIFG